MGKPLKTFQLPLMGMLAIIAGGSLVLGLVYAALPTTPAFAATASTLAWCVVGLLAGGLVLSLLDPAVRALTRQTASQCFRMKLTVGILLILLVILGTLPFMIYGDETLSGRIRTFLDYSLTAMTLLLSLLTVLTSLAIVCSDLSQRTVWMLMSKPLGRAEYLLGRFLGVMTVSAVLLVISGGMIFIVSTTLRNQSAVDQPDRQKIETDLFTARQELKPFMRDYQAEVEEHIEELKTMGEYENALKAFESEGSRRGKSPEEQLFGQMMTLLRKRDEIAPPDGALEWQFAGEELIGQSMVRSCKITRLYRSGLKGDRSKVTLVIWMEITEKMAGRLSVRAPVKVGSIPALVWKVDLKSVAVALDPSYVSLAEVQSLREGQAVELTTESTIQLRCEGKALVPSGGGSYDSIYRVLQFGVPSGEKDDQGRETSLQIGMVEGDMVLNSLTTASISATEEVKGGVLRVRYLNIRAPGQAMPSPPISLPLKKVSLLYRVGGFEGNFLRCCLLVLTWLAFLAAMGVFLGSFLSLPVGMLTALILLLGGAMLDWLIVQESTPKIGADIVSTISGVLSFGLTIILPSFELAGPGEKLVDGMLLPWSKVGQGVVLSFAVRGVMYLSVGCLIFRKRELASIQSE